MESKRHLPNHFKAIQFILIVLVVFVAGAIFGSQISISEAQGGDLTLSQENEVAFEPLVQTFNLINRTYIDPVDSATLVNGAITGMVEALDDRFSLYIDPEINALDTRLAGEYEGIGAVIGIIEDTEEIEIRNIFENSPAEQAGLQPGDIFIAVDGRDIVGFNTAELSSIVRGPGGTPVVLTMSRDGEEFEVTIIRDRVELVYVSSELLEGDILYIQLTQFSANAREQIDVVLNQYGADAINGLVFDLRGNGGGLLSSAVDIGGLFIEQGTLLIEQFGDGREIIFKKVDDSGTVTQIFDDGSERIMTNNAGFAGVTAPIIVLVDGNSASASELVAGAWQDTGVATILGTQTFGKGTVQQANTLVNGGGLNITIARWLTPTREWITDQGITPDIVVELPEELEEGQDPQLEAALEFIEDALESTVAP